MATTYNNLKIGSRGDEVKKMQEALKTAGYDIGSSGADGIYGSKTAAAVKQYQKDQGLSVDGVAGSQTLGKLYGTQNNTGVDTETSPVPEIKPMQTYNPTSDDAYQKALSTLTQAQQNAPSYSNSYDVQIKDLYDQIVNREKFSYDINSDMLYQQYRDNYINQGQMAMRDTMGQAAALTGGYGSSYAQQVGQQQYDAYLQQLNDVVPELYGMALDQYNAEGQDLYNLYNMTGQLADDEYAKYMDSYNRWAAERDYAQGLADQAYDRGYNDWANKYQLQQDQYDRLVSLVTGTGYTPTQEELLAAGMNKGQLDAYKQAYLQSITPKSSGGGGGGGTPKGQSYTTLYNLANKGGLTNEALEASLLSGAITMDQADTLATLQEQYMVKNVAGYDEKIAGSISDGIKNTAQKYAEEGGGALEQYLARIATGGPLSGVQLDWLKRTYGA